MFGYIKISMLGWLLSEHILLLESFRWDLLYFLSNKCIEEDGACENTMQKVSSVVLV